MPIVSRVRRAQLLLVALLLYGGVLTLSLAFNDPRLAVTVLYVIPIALTALAAGVPGGLLGAGLATCLLSIWVALDDTEVHTMGWVSRLVAFFVIGVLVGRYEDLARGWVRRRVDERAAAEIHDGVVQSLVLATYELRRGDSAAAERAVDDALEAAKRIISARLPAVQPGDLRLPTREGEPPGS